MFDITARIELAERTIKLFAEVKSSGQPRIARQAVNQMLRYKEKFADAYFVFIAPYISSKSADICVSEGVGYLDLSGNCLLSCENIFIQKKNYPNQFIEKRDLKSLYAPRAERVLRALLCNPGREWKIKELAAESAVSLGQASNVKKLLVDRELVSGKRGGFRIVDPVVLLREWADNYDYRKNEVQEFYSLKNVADVENTLAVYCNERKIKYALTGFSGAARIEPAVRYKKAMVYAADLGEEDFLKLSLKRVKRAATSYCLRHTIMVYFIGRVAWIIYRLLQTYRFIWICKVTVAVVKRLHRCYTKGLRTRRGNKNGLQSNCRYSSILGPNTRFT